MKCLVLFFGSCFVPPLPHIPPKNKEKDHTFESCDLDSSHPHASDLAGIVGGDHNVVRDQQSTQEGPHDDVLPLTRSEKLWEEVEMKEAKSTIGSEEQFKAESFADEMQANASSAEEQSSDEEKGDAILCLADRARKLVLLSVPERSESASDDSASDSADSFETEEKIPDSRESIMVEEEAEEALHREAPQADKAKRESRVDSAGRSQPGLCHKHQLDEPEKYHNNSKKNPPELASSQLLRLNGQSASFPVVALQDFQEDVKLNQEVEKEVEDGPPGSFSSFQCLLSSLIVFFMRGGKKMLIGSKFVKQHKLLFDSFVVLFNRSHFL